MKQLLERDTVRAWRALVAGVFTSRPNWTLIEVGYVAQTGSIWHITEEGHRALTRIPPCEINHGWSLTCWLGTRCCPIHRKVPPLILTSEAHKEHVA